jgi:hypothetical protein
MTDSVLWPVTARAQTSRGGRRNCRRPCTTGALSSRRDTLQACDMAHWRAAAGGRTWRTTSVCKLVKASLVLYVPPIAPILLRRVGSCRELRTRRYQRARARAARRSPCHVEGRVQRATCNVENATKNLQRATLKVQQNNLHRAASPLLSASHAACNASRKRMPCAARPRTRLC